MKIPPKEAAKEVKKTKGSNRTKQDEVFYTAGSKYIPNTQHAGGRHRYYY